MLTKLTQQQLQYLEALASHMKEIVEEHNIPQAEFEGNFVEILTASHNSYQRYLEGLLTDEEFRIKLSEAVWNEIRKDEK